MEWHLHIQVHVHCPLSLVFRHRYEELYLERYKIILTNNHMLNHFCTTNTIEGQTKAILKTNIQKPNPTVLPFKHFGHQYQHGTEYNKYYEESEALRENHRKIDQ